MNVLVVDDNRLNLAIAKDFLQKNSKIKEITVCEDSQKTLEIIEKKK